MLRNIAELTVKHEVILIVEDNSILRLALDEMLALDGFVVLTASNGVEALSHMKGQTPDLIISDIAMPEMDGYALFDRIRSNPDWLSIPFIFLTGRGTKDDILTGIREAGIHVTCIGEVLEDGEGVVAMDGLKPVAWPIFKVDEIARVFSKAISAKL